MSQHEAHETGNAGPPSSPPLHGHSQADFAFAMQLRHRLSAAILAACNCLYPGTREDRIPDGDRRVLQWRLEADEACRKAAEFAGPRMVRIARRYAFVDPESWGDALKDLLTDPWRGFGVRMDAIKDYYAQVLYLTFTLEHGDGGTPCTGLTVPKHHNPGMTVAQADKKARQLVHKLGNGFFTLSKTAQAKQIGCHLETWKKAPFYRQAQNRRPRRASAKPTSPKVVILTATRQEVIGEGAKDEVLRQVTDREGASDEASLAELIADQQNNWERSPLEQDPPDRRRAVHFRTRA